MKRYLAAFAAVALVALQAAACSAEDAKDKNLKVGDKAPVFSAKDQHGKEWTSKEVVGVKYLVVYFYPADMTGGCTKQACAFRDDIGKLRKKDVEVVGVSGDSVENHKLFANVHNLNFELLADEKGEIAKKFGVKTKAGGTISRKVEGKDFSLTRGVTASRWTFIIGKDGNIIYKDTSVKAAEDSKTVMAFIEKLGKE